MFRSRTGNASRTPAQKERHALAEQHIYRARQHSCNPPLLSHGECRRRRGGNNKARGEQGTFCRLQESPAGCPWSATLAQGTIGELTPQAACPAVLRFKFSLVAAAGVRVNDRWSRAQRISIERGGAGEAGDDRARAALP
ncbi:hypothetical protein MRX96_018811 [Rhipicephalus microplus]